MIGIRITRGHRDHADYLLHTAALLLRRGRLDGACDVLELLDRSALRADQIRLLESLADLGERLSLQEVTVYRAAPLGRLLPFSVPGPLRSLKRAARV